MSYKNLVLSAKASVEIENAIAHYAIVNKTLAIRLEQEIRSGFKAIVANPESFQCRYFEIRIFWLKKFPFGLYYICDNGHINILAFWHTKEDISSKLSKIM